MQCHHHLAAVCNITVHGILIGTHSRSPCIVDPGSVLPCGLAADSVICLISDLNHTYINARIMQFCKRIQCITVYFCRLLIQIHGCPCFRHFLLCRICPEIRIVKIDQHSKSSICRQLPEYLCFSEIIISTAVPMTVCIIWVVPHADTHPVDAGFFQQCKKSCIIQCIALKVMIYHTTFRLGNVTGNVHTLNKILRQIQLIYKNRCLHNTCQYQCIPRRCYLFRHGGNVTNRQHISVRFGIFQKCICF